MKEIKVIELFAGVGGFRIGLENASKKFKVVWSNQWEPGTNIQSASEIYTKRFGIKGHSNEDIGKVSHKNIPNHNLLVGGFPCQDYSVATTLKNSSGLEGKKGVLWWEIHRILKNKKVKPEFLLLENVDRLPKSPAKQRGRDFAIILSSLNKLGYIVEWRVINAAEYGMPQRRRRIFILAYKSKTSIYKKIKKSKNPESWITKEGVLAKAFKIQENDFKINEFELDKDIVKISDNFGKGFKISPFENSGIMINGKVYTAKVSPNYSGKKTTIRDIMIKEELVPEEFFIQKNSLEKWIYEKGAKKKERTTKEGFTYTYAEGAMIFPDSLDAPSRTIITGEGGTTPSRFKHVIETKNKTLRRLTPLELERLNMFPDNHTEGHSDTKRAFIMGNALVVGVIEKIGKSLHSKIKELD
ncbi:DNA (cytosine-5-)-methyltransferase [Methanococcoides sp. SA1]|nr:DNA (cytosine-5-)-methyltransferase [Methanococcoides sp. SA1]